MRRRIARFVDDVKLCWHAFWIGFYFARLERLRAEQREHEHERVEHEHEHEHEHGTCSWCGDPITITSTSVFHTATKQVLCGR